MLLPDKAEGWIIIVPWIQIVPLFLLFHKNDIIKQPVPIFHWMRVNAYVCFSLSFFQLWFVARANAFSYAFA